MANELANKSIVLGVSGGISAYRSLELIRLLTKAGAKVRVMPTRNALRFVSELSFEALSGQPCLSDGLAVNAGKICHIEEAERAHAVIAAPATCDLMAKMAHGMADELVLQTLLSFRGPCVIAPAMESNMWEHEATQSNVATLRHRGCKIVGPNSGALASGRNGIGRMAEPSEIFEYLLAALARQDFAGRTVLVTAGPTVEDLDPVRFISNRSSGKMGVALARALAQRGAKVHLVHGPMLAQVPNLPNILAHPVRSAAQMYEEVMLRIADCDTAVMCAAVADFTPVHVHEQKVKKASGVPEIELAKTRDILKAIGERRPKPFLVGFAAETENLEEGAFRKCVEKNCDLVCSNSVVGKGSAFDSDSNEMLVVDRNRSVTKLDKATKDEVAHGILDLIQVGYKKLLG